MLEFKLKKAKKEHKQPSAQKNIPHHHQKQISESIFLKVSIY